MSLCYVLKQLTDNIFTFNLFDVMMSHFAHGHFRMVCLFSFHCTLQQTSFYKTPLTPTPFDKASETLTLHPPYFHHTLY